MSAPIFPYAVQYDARSDRAVLWFSAPLQQGRGAGTMRLRIGSNEALPVAPASVNLASSEVGDTFAGSHELGNLAGSVLVSSNIDPQIYELELPGSNDEPGHRSISDLIQDHLHGAADSESGIATVLYNFRKDYGTDPAGVTLSNLISEDQKQRAREVFEIYGQRLGIQFVETASQGITVATGDLRAIDPAVATGRGGVTGLSGVSSLTGQPTVIMDNAENWYDLFGRSDDPLRPDSWFETAVVQIGKVLGLGDTYELPPGTMMGSEPELAFGMTPEPVYPGSDDIVHGQHLYRTEGKDVDVYRFQVTRAGVFTAEAIAERQAESSLLDSVISLYRESGGQRELVARNDDYYSEDSLVRVRLEPGTYYVGVSAAGNVEYNPEAADTGFGGVTEGRYDLRLDFRADAIAGQLMVDVDNRDRPELLSQATPLDGDADGEPGGVYNFWFRVSPRQIFVDTYVGPNESESSICPGTGSLQSPYCRISDATKAARAGDIIRIVGNGGTDGDLATPEDAQPYRIGFDLLGQPLTDGTALEIPKAVTVVVDRGAVVKLRRGYLEAGSHRPTEDRSQGVLQVLGTPRLIDDAGNVRRDAAGNTLAGTVFFTSLLDDSLGGDSVPNRATTPGPGDWGGIIFRRDLDRDAGRLDHEDRGLFANGVNQADLRYGGGTVLVDGIPQVIAPIQIADVRPTVTFNTIRSSADAAMSANPDSFRETDFQSPVAGLSYPLDYLRSGPDIHGNRLIDNSVNGLLVRVTTPAGQAQEEMTVTGRWDDTDIVHVVTENLRVRGAPGGPVQVLPAPDVRLVTTVTQGDGTIPAGTVDYRLTFVDAQGRESPASDPTPSVLVNAPDPVTGRTQSVQLKNLPSAADPVNGKLRLYRSVKSGAEYVLIAELATPLNGPPREYTDTGTSLGGLLQPSLLNLQARLHGQLKIDPGTVVKLYGAGIDTQFGSQLLAEGTADREIIFTSLQDVRYGAGGTFETSQPGGLAAGNWTGLYVGPMSPGSIDHAVVAYGGGVAEVPGSIAGFNALEIQQADVRIANTVFEYNADGTGGQAGSSREGRGENGSATVFVRGAQPVVVDNVLRGNEGPAISIDVNSLDFQLVADRGRSTGWLGPLANIVGNQGPLIRGNRLGDNEYNGMQVRGGTLTTQGVWDDTDIVHLLLDQTIHIPDFHTYGGLRLESSAAESLVVKLFGDDAGFTATGRPLDMTDRIGGMLHILGQPGHPVVLTSLYDDSIGAGFDPAGRPQTVTSKSPALIQRLEVIEESADSGNTFVGPGVGVSTDGLGTADTGTLQAEIPLDATIERAYLHVATRNIRTAPALILPATISFQGVAVPLTWLPNVMDSDLLDFETGRADVTDIVRTVVGAGGAIFDFDVDETVTGIAANIEGTSLSVVYSDPAVIEERTVILMDGGISGPRPQAGTVTFAAPIDFANNPTFVAQMALGIQSSDNTLGTQFSYVEVDRQPVTGSAGNADDGDVVNGESITVGGVGDSLANPADPFDPQHLDPDDELYTLNGYLGDGSQSFNLEVGNPAGGDSIFLIALTLSGIAEFESYSVGAPADWSSVRLDQWSADRNVEVAVEAETGNVAAYGSEGVNDAPSSAQHLGQLAPHEYGGDDIRRLGFEIAGSLNRYADSDVYSFTADVGTEVWLDIDRTSQALDTVLELIDSDGRVIARSDDSGAELAVGEPSYYNRTILYDLPTYHAMSADDVGPLKKSLQGGQDLWTTNPKDAGMRVTLPGPAGTTNTYYVRVSGGTVLTDDRDFPDRPWCGTPGLDPLAPCATTDLVFRRGAPDRIIDVNNGLSAAGFVAGQQLIVSGTTDGDGDRRGDNDGIYTIASVSPGQITLSASGVLKDDDAPPGARLQTNTALGAYQMQIRLRETDELPGSTVQAADIRYATNGIELFGLPAHSPLTGEAAEAVDTLGNDDNDVWTGADVLGNLLNTDRGTLSVAGNIAAHEVQALVFPTPPVQGNYVLTFGGRATRNIPFNADAAAIQYALQSLPTIGPGNLVVAGSVANGFTLKFQGTLANQDVGQITAASGAPAIDVVPLVATVVDGRAWDVDWYQFDVRYDSVAPEVAAQQQYVSTIFDIDYADGLARANTNLWIFDAQGRLVLAGRDSDVPEDRPLGADPGLDDLSRGSVGALDPFIGPAALPTYGLASGTYFVAVSSNAAVPESLAQFLSPLPANPLVRLEPVTSVNRIAEDHLDGQGVSTTAAAPQVPELFGAADQVTLYPPRASELVDGESFTLTNAAGSSKVYEFDFDGRVATGRVAIPLHFQDTAQDVGAAIATAILENLPESLVLPDPLDPNPPQPTASQPLVYSTIDVELGDRGEVRLREHVVRRTLLSQVTTYQTDPANPANQILVTTPFTRETARDIAPVVSQKLSPSAGQLHLFVSRPGVMPYRIGDVTLFVTEPGRQDALTGIPTTDNRNDLVAVDAYTGQLETRIGALGWNVGDLASHPQGSLTDGGLFAFSIWEPSTSPAGQPATTDANTGNYVQIDPGRLPAAGSNSINLATSPGDDEIVTYVSDPANPGTPVVANNKAGVGVLFNALTFTNPEASAGSVRGFAVGNRGDAADAATTQVARVENLLFEFEPDTGTVIPGRKQVFLSDGGTDKVERGDLNTRIDTFPADGRILKLAGVDATIEEAGATTARIDDGDFFDVTPADGFPIRFEFDSGWEYVLDVNVSDPLDPQTIRDGDFFVIDGTGYEFDTGSVLAVLPGAQGSELVGQTTSGSGRFVKMDIRISGVPGGDVLKTFVFVETANTPLLVNEVGVVIRPAFGKQQIVDAIIQKFNEVFAAESINGVRVEAVELGNEPGSTVRNPTGRITFRMRDDATKFFGINATLNPPANTTINNLRVDGSDNVSNPARVRIAQIEETSSAAEIATATVLAVAPNEAGSKGNRLNILGPNNVSFAGVSHPIFQAPGAPPKGLPGIGGTGTGVTPYSGVQFLVSDNAERIAQRMELAINGSAIQPPIQVSRDREVVALMIETTDATFACNPVGAPGAPNCPLRSGADAAEGNITGIAFIGAQLFAVSDGGGLFRVVDEAAAADGTRGLVFNPNATTNVLDYVDGSREALAAANELPIAPEYTYVANGASFADNGNTSDTITVTESVSVSEPFSGLSEFVTGGRLKVSGSGSNNGEYTILRKSDPVQVTINRSQYWQVVISLGADDRLVAEDTPLAITLQQTRAPIHFAGLVAGPQNAEEGRYENILFAISDTGRLFAFDTLGRPQPVFANSTAFADTGIVEPRGLAFSTLDDNLWHSTTNRNSDQGHGIQDSFDGSRQAEDPLGNASLYFGYENSQVQPQFGTGTAYAPATQGLTYDFPGGAQGSLVSNPFSLQGYSSADKPTLYFNYFLATENANATLDSGAWMRDAVRVYGAGDDGRWLLLTTNNTATGPKSNDDEFDLFQLKDPVTGQMVPEQAIDRSETFDNTGSWRQARIDLAPLAGQEHIRLRFDFSTAGGMTSGGRDAGLDLNTAGNELRAIPGADLRDGQLFTLGALDPDAATTTFNLVAGFEFELGPTIVAPTGAAIREGDTFSVDGTVFEFSSDDVVGFTDFVQHIRVSYTAQQTAGDLAAAIQGAILTANPFATVSLADLDLLPEDSSQNDTLALAAHSGLNGTQQTLTGEGLIGDNTKLQELGIQVPANENVNRRDVDMLALRLDVGDRIVVEVNSTSPAPQLLDPYVRLFDALGNELAANDDVGSSASIAGRNARLDYLAISGGTYYVGISAAHYRAYDPTEMGTGQKSDLKAESEGRYQYTIAVTAPDVQRVGNRVNLPQAGVVTVPAGSNLAGLPLPFVDGAGGVRTGLPNPANPSAPAPVVPVRVNVGMSRPEVADAIRLALAEHFGGGDPEAVKSREEFVQIVQYGVMDAGPLGLSGPSDPATAIANSGLFGDRFGAFDISAGVDGQITPATPGALRMQNNQFEGLYIDDILIGFASRGELVTGSLPDAGTATGPAFVANTDRPANQIDQGVYQLEIRQAPDYATPVTDETGVTRLDQYQVFDVDQRMSEGVALRTAAGRDYREGQTFTVSDGTTTVVFEFDDLTTSGSVSSERFAVPFDPSDSDVAIARRLRDALNAAASERGLQLQATSPDGPFAGPASTSNRVDLHGDLTVSVGSLGRGPAGSVPVEEGNDVVGSSVDTGIRSSGQPDSAIVAVEATILVAGQTIALIDDGDFLDLRENATGQTIQLEFDAGDDFSLDLNVNDPNDPQVIRDGDKFTVGSQVYEFDTSSVLFVQPAARGSALIDPSRTWAYTLQVRVPNVASATVTFEFVPKGGVRLSSFIPIEIEPAYTRSQIVTAIVAAINSAGPGDTTGKAFAIELTGPNEATGRITMGWQPVDPATAEVRLIEALLGAFGTPPVNPPLAVEGQPGVSAFDVTPVYVEETSNAAEIGQAIRSAVAGNGGVEVGTEGNRLNFLNASVVDVSAVSHPIFERVGTPGPTSGDVSVPFLASDDSDAIAQRIFDTLVGLNIGATVQGEAVRLTNAGAAFFCSPPGLSTSATCPLITDAFRAPAPFHATGVIGDNPNVLPFSADVDLYRVGLLEGETLSIDIDASELGSPLDSVLRVFYADGSPVLALNAYGELSAVENDDSPAPGETSRLPSWQTANKDAYLVFTAPTNGTYYIGVSGLGNEAYDIHDEGSGRPSGTSGKYEIDIRPVGTASPLQVIEYAGSGFENLFRDQGQIVLRGNTIRDSWEYGIRVEGAARDATDATYPGAVRNLSHVNTARLVPGVVITNNILPFNRVGGIRFAGDPGSTAGPAQQPAAVPFGRIVNNTVFGGTAHKTRPSQVDVVLMIDTSGSMADEIAEVRERLAGFDAEMTKARIDANYGLVTFPGTNPNADPKLLQDIVDFNSFINGPFSTFALTGGTEKGSRAVREALNDFDDTTTFNFRPGSTVVTVLITDEGDNSPPEDLGLAINASSVAEAVFFGITMNPSIATDSDGDPNHYSQIAAATGGQVFDIGTFRLDPASFFEAFTAAVTGGVVRPASVGIEVINGASPTILNNVVVAKRVGIQVDASSQTTVLAGNAYQDNTDATLGVAHEDFPMYLESTDQIFQKPYAGNFYPSAGSKLIDSSLESLEDRFDLVQIKQELGISLSPVLVRNEDQLGQIRVDDPAIAPPVGIGENVFKDRGALDRADFQGPTGRLLVPLDNGGDDLDLRANSVNIVTATPDNFTIQLTDRLDGNGGIGVDDQSVTSHSVKILENDLLLTEGVDYAFEYHAANKTIRLTPLAGLWKRDHSYVIQLANVTRITISGKSGADLTDGESFELTDPLGGRVTYEFDSGYVIEVPQTLAVQIPAAGGGSGGVADGDLVTITDATHSVTLEFDNNGVFSEANERVQFSSISSQGEIADALVAALKRIDVFLSPVNAGSGLVHLGVDGTQDLAVVSTTVLPVGSRDGVQLGEEFTIDDFSRLVSFTFTTGTSSVPGRVSVPFKYSQTHREIAASITSAVNLAGLGLFTFDLGDGRVLVGGGPNHTVDVTNSALVLTGEPGVRREFGLRIPTV
ncbi:MAG: pre-peptidase C-terminal domain-containing protein, partial [Pirellulaceae bacterium]|nr:pre-peptidase C-terminal domain-containing protein [Pirellulaceae bacterium]